MLHNTQQLMITSDRFSILWSRQFREHLHLAFKITKARSTATLAADKNLLIFFCSWNKFKLLENCFTSQVFAGYAPSPIRRGLSCTHLQHQLVQLAKYYGRLEYTMLDLVEYDHHGYCRDSLLLYQKT